MRFLHTADWHIGNLFHEYDRYPEHQQFLQWLEATLQQESIDVLLVSGDVFDLSNPSAAAIKLFYSFLRNATASNSNLQVIIIAGNHDSASRLEAPKPLLENSKIHIIGVVERNADGEIDYEKLIIPINDQHGNTKGYCMAVPFLRPGDHPVKEDCNNPYAEGIKSFYHELHDRVNATRKENEFIVAMGHLHAQKAETSEQDSIERAIMGGVESIAADAFHSNISYVALGHIHKAQRIGGMEHIRYSGSPIPMSFSEINYKHQVICFEMIGTGVQNLRSIEVPVSIPLLQVPKTHLPLEQVLEELSRLEQVNTASLTAPYLQVRVLLNKPEPSLRHQVEQALKDKNVKLARIDVKYPRQDDENKLPGIHHELLDQLRPYDIFSRMYQNRYNNPVPTELTNLFNEIAQEIQPGE